MPKAGYGFGSTDSQVKQKDIDDPESEISPFSLQSRHRRFVSRSDNYRQEFSLSFGSFEKIDARLSVDTSYVVQERILRERLQGY